MVIAFQKNEEKKIFKSSIHCDINLYPKETKFLQIGASGADFSKSKKQFSSRRNANLKIFFDYDIIVTSQPLYSPQNIINCPKSVVC